MKLLVFLLALLFLASCTTTHVYRTDGINEFKASNTSIGWDREEVDLSLSKKPDDMQVGVKIGKSGGSAGLDRAITGIENGLEALKALRP